MKPINIGKKRRATLVYPNNNGSVAIEQIWLYDYSYEPDKYIWNKKLIVYYTDKTPIPKMVGKTLKTAAIGLNWQEINAKNYEMAVKRLKHKIIVV